VASITSSDSTAIGSTRELTWEGVDWRPVHDNASDAVVLSNDDVGELGHVLDFGTGIAGRVDKRRTGVGAFGGVEPLYLLAFLMRHVEFVEHFVGRFADGERVHQEATEPEAAAEIVVFSTTMTFTPCSASSLAAISPEDRHRR